ncbi:MAG: peptidoglycan DD-metalloendopeptidase family protein [Ilumatobacteraceae bacterium]
MPTSFAVALSTFRRLTAPLAVAALALSVVSAAGAVAAFACWLPPVGAPVVDPFRPPPCSWCAGNRGLEYGTADATVVRAVAAGVVTFSGRVAVARYVVVRHADGRRATYGGLAGSSLGVGDAVASRSVIGTTVGHLHFGLRDGDTYLDPAPFLGRLVGRPRLVPDDGTPRRTALPPRLRCD